MADVRAKLCGITRLEDAEAAVEAGAWALGLNFWPGTARRVEPEVAAAIAARLRRRVELVGLFVNARLDEVVATADAIPLGMVQLHGDEGPAYCAAVARRTGARVIKAVRVRDRGDVRALTAFHTDFHLLDAHVEGARGGTGHGFDWTLAAAHRADVPVVLGGGLHAGNVGEAIEAVRPYGVDTASGIESGTPGVKDHAKIAAFMEAVRSASLEPAA